MAISKEEVLEAISSMSVLDLSELIKEMEEKFGVSAAAMAVAAAPEQRPRPLPQLKHQISLPFL